MSSATSLLPPSSPEWFLHGYTPEVLTSDFVIRSLRRRLWKAFQEDNVESALRAYQATREDFEQWLDEEQVEREHQIELKQQQEQLASNSKVRQDCPGLIVVVSSPATA